MNGTSVEQRTGAQQVRPRDLESYPKYFPSLQHDLAWNLLGVRKINAALAGGALDQAPTRRTHYLELFFNPAFAGWQARLLNGEDVILRVLSYFDVLSREANAEQHSAQIHHLSQFPGFDQALQRARAARPVLNWPENAEQPFPAGPIDLSWPLLPSIPLHFESWMQLHDSRARYRELLVPSDSATLIAVILLHLHLDHAADIAHPSQLGYMRWAHAVLRTLDEGLECREKGTDKSWRPTAALRQQYDAVFPPAEQNSGQLPAFGDLYAIDADIRSAIAALAAREAIPTTVFLDMMIAATKNASPVRAYLESHRVLPQQQSNASIGSDTVQNIAVAHAAPDAAPLPKPTSSATLHVGASAAIDAIPPSITGKPALAPIRPSSLIGTRSHVFDTVEGPDELVRPLLRAMIRGVRHLTSALHHNHGSPTYPSPASESH